MKKNYASSKRKLVFALKTKVKVSMLKMVLPLLALLFSNPVKSQYCNSNFGSVCCEWITNVTFGSINNTTTNNVGGPVNYTSQVANVIPGIATTMQISIQSDFCCEYVMVFIDWNQNGTLNDSGEMYTIATNVGNGAVMVLTPFAITPPFSAIPGNTRMRVICVYGSNGGNLPCMSQTYGEAEDYTVFVIPPTPCTTTPPANTVVATTTLVCPVFGTAGLGLSTQYTLGAITYSWQSSTTSALGPYTNITGANASAYTTPTLNTTTYYQLVAQCSNGGITTTATPIQIQVAGTTTNTVPYFESFEGITTNKQLPNCSWTRSDNYQCSSSTASVNAWRVARTGTKFGEFDASNASYYNTRMYYSNGIQMFPGITYSASVWYITQGYSTWYDFGMLVGPNQSATSQTLLASIQYPSNTNYNALQNTFQVPTAGLYYMCIRATEYGYGQQMAWDDLQVIAPCSFTNNGANINVTGPTQICAGQTANYTASGAGTYSWSTGQTTSTLSVSPPFTTTYLITGTNPNTGCYATTSQALQVNQLPLVSVVAFKTSVCVGGSVNMFATTANTFTWNNGTQSSAISVTPAVTTVYTVSGTDAMGCVGTATQQIVVNPLPIIAIVPASKTICKGEAANLTASGATGATSYGWASNDLFLQTLTFAGYPQATTVFTVSGTDVNGCTGTANVVVTVEACLGIAAVTGGSATKAVIYPNPNNGDFTVELNNGLTKTIEVVDLTGRVVLTNTTDHNQVKVNISTLSNGVYYVKVKSANTVEVLRVVKQ